jgi:hypothetical protein
VGITDASQKIEIDRYSLRSDTNVLIAFLDTTNTFKGWKAILDHRDAWIRYNRVDFGNEPYRAVLVRASSPLGSNLQIRLDDADGPLLSEVLIPGGTDWKTVDSPVSDIPPGIHHLVVVLNGDKPVEIDWIRFTD